MRMQITAAALAVAASAAGPLQAQDACQDAAKILGKAPRLGEWAEYTFQKADAKEKPSPMRGAFIKSEERDGRTLYWLQMLMPDPKGGKPMIVQALMPWDPSASGRPEIVESVMKMGDQPAIKMPSGMPKQSNAPDFREECKKSKFVGEEKVTVPAGTFTARHYQSPDGEMWVSADAPVWHLVKFVSKKGDTMTLSARGTGAKSEITETPMSMGEMMKGGKAPSR